MPRPCNWGKALAKTLKHVCDSKAAKASGGGGKKKPVNFNFGGAGGVASWGGVSSSSANSLSFSTSSKSKRKETPQKLISRINAGDTSAIPLLLKAMRDPKNQPTSTVLGEFPTGKPGQTVRTTQYDFSAYGVKPFVTSSYYKDGKPDVDANNKRVWNNTTTAVKHTAGEVSGWYNFQRVWTGKDPVTGDKANRWLAFGGLALDAAGYLFPIAKLGKVGKGSKAAATATKTIDTVDDVSDATTAYRASKGLKAADTVDDVSDTTRVGRWMSPEEYEKMMASGKVQMSDGNMTHVANPADINAFKASKPGTIYVEFDVPSSSLKPGGTNVWSTIPGPGSRYDKLYGIPEMPDAINIKIVGRK